MSGGNLCLCTELVDSFTTNITIAKNTTYTRKYLYNKKYLDSALEVFFDATYQIAGNGGDSFYSQILADSTSNPTTLFAEHMQIFNGNDGGGTRSSTIFPIIGIITGLLTGDVYISLNIINDADDTCTISSPIKLIVREYNNFSTVVVV